ncbi:MAG: hypothetical protein M3042_09150 [Actinomycetota bacterium]|nr:hypothetical protein [Actinomycetota bacterium]
MSDSAAFRVHPAALDALSAASRDGAQLLTSGRDRFLSTPVPPAVAFGNLSISSALYGACTGLADRGRAAAGSLSAVVGHDVGRLDRTAAAYKDSDATHSSMFSRLLDTLNPLGS